jgi:hypothetical protein
MKKLFPKNVTDYIRELKRFLAERLRRREMITLPTGTDNTDKRTDVNKKMLPQINADQRRKNLRNSATSVGDLSGTGTTPTRGPVILMTFVQPFIASVAKQSLFY